MNQVFHEKADFTRINTAAKAHSTVAKADVSRLTHDKYEFVGQLECIHYQYYEKYSGGLSHLITLGHQDSISVFESEKERTCSGADVDNMLFPSFPPAFMQR